MSKLSTISTLVLAISVTVATATAQDVNTDAVKQEPKQEWHLSHLADGQPDFEGFWGAVPTGTFDLMDPRTGGGRLEEILKERNGQVRKAKPSRITDPADGKIPYQPWAAAKQLEQSKHTEEPETPGQIDTQARCFLDGASRGFFHTGFQIIQTPKYVLFLWEQNSEYRIIPLDNTPHVGSSLALWQGDSRGHWEGDTLVIDITNLNAKARLDMVGNFYSPTAHVVERFTRLDDKTIRYEATFTDPAVYTRPWTLASNFVRNHAKEPNYEQWEDACHEGERSAETMILTTKANQRAATKKKADVQK